MKFKTVIDFCFYHEVPLLSGSGGLELTGPPLALGCGFNSHYRLILYFPITQNFITLGSLFDSKSLQGSVFKIEMKKNKYN